MRIYTAGRVGFFFASSLALSACGGSSSPSAVLDDVAESTGLDTAPTAPQADAPAVTAPVEAPAPVSTPVPADDPVLVAPTLVEETPAAPVSEPVEATTPDPVVVEAPPAAPTPTVPVSAAPPSGDQIPVQGTIPDLVASNFAAGITVSGGDDDSPTEVESLSLVGPFLKDTTRSAGPPSVPTGLVALMKSDNWVEFTWVGRLHCLFQ